MCVLWLHLIYAWLVGRSGSRELVWPHQLDEVTPIYRYKSVRNGCVIEVLVTSLCCLLTCFIFWLYKGFSFSFSLGSWPFYNVVQTFPELALRLTRLWDYMTVLVQASSEATGSWSSSPMIVSRDVFSPWTWARFQISRTQTTLADVTRKFCNSRKYWFKFMPCHVIELTGHISNGFTWESPLLHFDNVNPY